MWEVQLFTANSASSHGESVLVLRDPSLMERSSLCPWSDEGDMTFTLGNPESGRERKSYPQGALSPIRETERLPLMGRHSCPQEALGLCNQRVGRR